MPNWVYLGVFIFLSLVVKVIVSHNETADQTLDIHDDAE